MKLLSKKSKGILILSLILLAKSASSSDGASFFDYSQRAHRRAENLFDNKKKSQGPGGGSSPRSTARQIKEFPSECPNSTPQAADGACSASPKPTFPLPRLLPLTGIFPRARSFLSSRYGKVGTVKRFAEDCCVGCSHCMDPKTFAAKCPEIPRGGNLDPLSQAATAATAATMTAPYGIPLNAWKVIFQALLTTMNVFCWLIPLRSKKISENKLALSLANAFSGGVFLSLAFGHLIPECVEGFAEVASENLSHTTPYMLVLVGYLLIFFVEKVAFDHDDLMEALGPGSESESPQSESLLSHGSSHESQRQLKAQENGVDQQQQATETGSSSGRSALILLGALAIHSVLEMMALGLSRNFGDCALLSLSIALHQPAESIALLVAFLKSGMPKEEIFQFLAVFSCMGPIGVLLGMIVSEFAAPIVESVMLAIVAGTFVYVGATEVIPEEWEDSENKWKKFLALMSGIVAIMVITQYTMSLENSVSNAAAEALIL